mgnify:CR=1 FL=1|jgi:hypothetical protein
MSKEEYDKLLKKLQEFKKKVLSSKEAAQNFLIEAGIHDKNGKLSENYK